MIRVYFFMNSVDMKLGLVVSSTLFFVIVMSKLIGGLLPLIAKSLNQDPAAMAAPLITTIVDALALLIYFALAITFLQII